MINASNDGLFVGTLVFLLSNCQQVLNNC